LRGDPCLFLFVDSYGLLFLYTEAQKTSVHSAFCILHSAFIS